MVDKQVQVTLRAKVDQYLQAMRQASKATGDVATGAQRDFQRLGTSMQSVGRTMSVGVTAPLVGIGGAAVGAASQFESAFSRMQGLAGVSASEVEGLQEAVLGLSGTTAQSPLELSEALYFLRSSGLDGAEALDALEQSAMASAAGMGDTAVIADAVSSAMNAYAASGLSAAEATDILVATARAGKAEPTELAGALGRVLPIASELGITFQDVGGAISSLSLAGNDASTSATLLQNIMSKLLKPTQQGAEALEAVGLSAQGIRESIEEQGLLGTLEMLRSRLGDSGFVRFLEDAQAVQGALALTGQNADQVRANFDAVNSAAGATGEAFSKVADDDAFKMSQAMADIQTAMILAGQVLLPVVADIASGVAGAASAFSDLNPVVQKIIIGFAGLAAAGGPALIVAGSLVKNFTSLKTAFAGAGSAASKASLALGVIGLAIGAAVTIHQAMTREQRELDARTREVAGALGEQIGAAWDLATAAEGATGAIDGLTLANDALGRTLAMTGENGEKIKQAFGALSLDISDLVTWMDMLKGNELVRGDAFRSMAGSAGVAAEHIGILADTVEQTNANGDELASILAVNLENGLGISTEAAIALADSLMPVASAMEELDDQSERFDGNAVTREFLQLAAGSNDLANRYVRLAETQTGLSRNGDHTRSVMAKLLEIVDALGPEAEAAARAALGLDGAVAQAAIAAQDAQSGFSGVSEETREWIDAMEHADAMLREQGGAWSNVSGSTREWVAAMTELDGKLLRTEGSMANVSEETREWIRSANRVGDAVDEFPEYGPFQYWEEGTKGASDAINDMVGQLDGVEDAAYDAAAGFDELNAIVNTLRDSFLNFHEPADNAREATRLLYEEAEQTAEALANASEEGLTLAEAFSYSTETGRENQRQMEEHRDAIYGHALAMMEEGASAEEAAGHIAWNTDALRENLLAAYDDEAAVDALIATYFRTPEEVETELELIGVAMAAAEIASHKTRLGGIERVVTTEVKVFATGLSSVLNAIGSIPRNVNVAANLAAQMRAHGGYRDQPELAVWGHGPEVMFPLADPNRVRELWQDPNVHGPMISALGAMSSAAMVQPTAGDVYNVNTTVNNNGRELVPEDVARAVRRALVTS
jgi:TP901 family phage tail tape measure protein